MALSLSQSIWKALLVQRDALAGSTLASLFDADPQRFTGLSRRADDLLLDVSKQRLTREILVGLCAFAEASGFAPARERLFGAKSVNVSEDRPALHWALRLPHQHPVVVSGSDVMPAV
ncbi:MAG: glucose-6-phosphate isomerase, partial [Betaproteobacteria bacterium]